MKTVEIEISPRIAGILKNKICVISSTVPGKLLMPYTLSVGDDFDLCAKIVAGLIKVLADKLSSPTTPTAARDMTQTVQELAVVLAALHAAR